jgi:O-antigen/teichoic acid export membrane protein
MRVFGESYVGGATVLRLLCIAAIAEVVNGIVGQVIAIKSMWVRFGFDVLLVCSLLLSSYVLIPRWRGVGFAAAYAVAFFVVAGGLLVYAGCSGYPPVQQASAPAEVAVEA